MQKVSNKLRVLHYAQIPCKPFVVEVKDEEQALLITEALTNQHLFLFDNNIIPDYSNAIIVQMWDENSDGEGNPDWVDYYNEKENMDFDEFVDAYLSN
jgi:Superinfection exclusion gene product 17